MILKSDQTIFTNGEDKPLPGGLAKGVGNLSPQIPYTKCGTALASKAPEKNAAKY